MWYDSLVEKDRVPDFIIRKNIRKLLTQRLQEVNRGSTEAQQAQLMQLIEELKRSEIAINTKDTDDQHNELPTEFYQYCLGRHLKYSCGFWKKGVTDLDTSERDMLQLTCERADLHDGQEVLELGCGWGSLSLYMAVNYPKSKFIAVSDSQSHKRYIDEQVQKRGITNLIALTEDINDFTLNQTFDRVVSVELFEHMRNYQKLLKKISGFLKMDGKLFVHLFSHKEFAYKFEGGDESDWMSKYFFTGGIMPSSHLLLYFNDHVTVEKHWHVNGTHYSKTAEAWLQNMDKHKKEIIPLFIQTYGEEKALKWWVYWRIFYIACSELWGYNNGDEWMISHYLFNKKQLLS